eukprot:10133934-Alexandrium_andersonii.AAC.1
MPAHLRGLGRDPWPAIMPMWRLVSLPSVPAPRPSAPAPLLLRGGLPDARLAFPTPVLVSPTASGRCGAALPPH